MKNIIEIAKIIKSLNNDKEILAFFNEIMTNTELETLSKRWQIIKLLLKNTTQRKIAQDLNVSLCKVTKGAKILKSENSTVKMKLKEKCDD